MIEIITKNGYKLNAHGLQPKLWQAGGYELIAEDNHGWYNGTSQNVCRVKTDRPVIESLAIRIEVKDLSTSKFCAYSDNQQVNCKITFLGDGEPDQYTNGVLYFQSVKPV